MGTEAEKTHTVEISEGQQLTCVWQGDRLVGDFPNLAAGIWHLQQEAFACTGPETPIACTIEWNGGLLVEARLRIDFPVPVRLTGKLTFELGV